MTNNHLAVWMHCRGNPNWIDEDTWLEWRSDEIPTTEPIQAELDAAMSAVNAALVTGAVSIESDKYSITGNGTDAATVTVTFRLPFPDYVLLNCGGQPVPINFTAKSWAGAPFERTAQITNLTSTLPGETIIIEPVDWFAPDFPGGEAIMIEVANGV